MVTTNASWLQKLGFFHSIGLKGRGIRNKTRKGFSNENKVGGLELRN